MNTIVQDKIGFLLCQNPTLGTGQFVLQAGGPQYIYQILMFENDDQYKAFQVLTKEKYLKLEGYRIAIRLSCALQKVDVTQNNARDVCQSINQVMGESLNWYAENYVYGNQSMNQYKEEQK